MPVELNRDNYDSEVFESDLPVMVDFWGPKCGPCLALMPSVEDLATEYEGKLKVAKLDVSGNRMLCAKLRVMGLPAFLFYKNGEEVNRISGEQLTRKDLTDAIDNLLG